MICMQIIVNVTVKNLHENKCDVFFFYKKNKRIVYILFQAEAELGGLTRRLQLIEEDDYEDYCKELVEEVGDLPKDLPSQH